MTWDILDKSALTSFIASVETTSEAPLFNPAYTEVKRLKLPFYQTLCLYRLTNFASMPLFTMHFIGDGSHFFYIDGTETPLIRAQEKGELILSPKTIMAYLNFYFFAVVQSEGEVFVVRDTAAYPYQDALNVEETPAFSFGTPRPDIHPRGDGGFDVETPLFIDGTLMRTQIQITTSGRVIIAPQKIIVTEGTTTHAPV